MQAPLAPSFAFTGEVKRTEWYSTVSPALTLSLTLALTLALALTLSLTLTLTLILTLAGGGDHVRA